MDGKSLLKEYAGCPIQQSLGLVLCKPPLPFVPAMKHPAITNQKKRQNLLPI